MPRKRKVSAETPPVASTAASGAVIRTASDQLPLHSPLGASSAERWMNCPGSTVLVASLGPTADEDDPEYRRRGILAHELASRCLTDNTDCYEEMAGFPLLGPDDAAAVQTYLNYVRSLPEDGQQFVEKRVHLPEFHPQFYGTVDFALVNRNRLAGIQIVDYKHGEGVVVEVENNPQLMYYAFGFIEADPELYWDEEAVTLTIVQPRVPWHQDGVIRSWETSAGALRKWAYETLRPAMERKDIEFTLGDWCRFCPAKLLCPAMREAVDNAAAATAPDSPLRPETMTEEQMAWYLGLWPATKMFYKALEERADRILLSGGGGSELKAVRKVVNKLSDRVWKDGAEVQIVAKLGQGAAYTLPALISPAVAAKLPGGPELVAEYAFKPDNGLTGAPIGDRRRAVDVKPLPPLEERYAVDTKPPLW